MKKELTEPQRKVIDVLEDTTSFEHLHAKFPEYSKFVLKRILWSLSDRGLVSLEVPCRRSVCAGRWQPEHDTPPILPDRVRLHIGVFEIRRVNPSQTKPIKGGKK